MGLDRPRMEETNIQNPLCSPQKMRKTKQQVEKGQVSRRQAVQSHMEGAREDRQGQKTMARGC